MPRRQQGGVTLLEIMIAMAVVLLGVMGLFRVISAASQGSSSAQRFTQATARAREVIEAIRSVPTPVLNCLVGTPVNGWTACEDQCTAARGGAGAAQSCVFVTLANIGAGTDRTRQAYQVAVDADLTRSSWVAGVGGSGRVYDIQITIGWNDNGTAAPVQHRVTLRSAIFR